MNVVYVANEWHLLALIAGAFALVFLVVAGACAVVNLIARRRVLRPWAWGGMVTATWFVLAVAYHFVMVYGMRPVG